MIKWVIFVKKNIIFKILTILILVILLFGCLQVFALEDVIDNPGGYEPEIQEDQEIAGKVGNILHVLNVVGVILAVIVMAVFGIKYMMGSLEERAEYKKTLIPYIVGIVLLLLASSIPNIVYQLVSSTLD